MAFRGVSDIFWPFFVDFIQVYKELLPTFEGYVVLNDSAGPQINAARPFHSTIFVSFANHSFASFRLGVPFHGKHSLAVKSFICTIIVGAHTCSRSVQASRRCSRVSPSPSAPSSWKRRRTSSSSSRNLLAAAAVVAAVAVRCFIEICWVFIDQS